MNGKGEVKREGEERGGRTPTKFGNKLTPVDG